MYKNNDRLLLNCRGCYPIRIVALNSCAPCHAYCWSPWLLRCRYNALQERLGRKFAEISSNHSRNWLYASVLCL